MEREIDELCAASEEMYKEIQCLRSQLAAARAACGEAAMWMIGQRVTEEDEQLCAKLCAIAEGGKAT